ncbi:uncharacterized protein Dsimw501_GD29299 [Drosophila simulans]|uniref:Uncharacterized protein n=1 Tax=Drosophila simulans TaxID=7240 RepID=A0A0J9RH78_DROSI|nr:uncharacterized protein Dsimw501_GD29299 [Drosophila simulans]
MKLVQCRWTTMTSPLADIAHPPRRPSRPSRPAFGMGVTWDPLEKLPCATCRVSGVRVCKQLHCHVLFTIKTTGCQGACTGRLCTFHTEQRLEVLEGGTRTQCNAVRHSRAFKCVYPNVLTQILLMRTS